MGIRRGNPAAEPDLRDYLLAAAVDFRATYGKPELGTTADGQTAWDILSRKVDALLDGRAIEFNRFELPPGHPLEPPAAGHPNDTLILGEDDVIRRPPPLNGQVH
jgi:hypothetical protein